MNDPDFVEMCLPCIGVYVTMCADLGKSTLLQEYSSYGDGYVLPAASLSDVKMVINGLVEAFCGREPNNPTVACILDFVGILPLYVPIMHLLNSRKRKRTYKSIEADMVVKRAKLMNIEEACNGGGMVA